MNITAPMDPTMTTKTREGDWAEWLTPLPVRADECMACRVGLGQGLTLIARAKAPMDQYCIQCADWLDKAAV